MGGGMCAQLDACAWAGEMGGIGERAKRGELGEPAGRNATTTQEGTAGRQLVEQQP